VRGMVLAGSPDFVEKEGAGLVGATMQIKSQAPFFLARWCDERAKFGFEEDVLAFFGAESDDQGDGIFREFGDRCAARTPADRPLRGFAGFPFGHVGGDCTPNSFNRKKNRDTPLVHLKGTLLTQNGPPRKALRKKERETQEHRLKPVLPGPPVPSSGQA
jgi:hypothetical protein